MLKKKKLKRQQENMKVSQRKQLLGAAATPGLGRQGKELLKPAGGSPRARPRASEAGTGQLVLVALHSTERPAAGLLEKLQMGTDCSSCSEDVLGRC